MPKFLLAVAAAVLLPGCTTRIQQLELKRDQLLRIETAAAQIRSSARNGEFVPERYDLYLLLNRSVFDTLMRSFDGIKVTVDASGRPVEFALSSMRINFRPGNPEVIVSAIARDQRSGLEAAVDMDSHLLIERESDTSDTLYMRVVATRIVPRITWGPFDFTRRAFVRSLLSLQATKLTERLPRATVPAASRFAIGGPAGTQAITLPTGEGTITGNITFPTTRQDRQVVVKHILSLKNGVHLFANVQTIP